MNGLENTINRMEFPFLIFETRQDLTWQWFKILKIHRKISTLCLAEIDILLLINSQSNSNFIKKKYIVCTNIYYLNLSYFLYFFFFIKDTMKLWKSAGTWSHLGDHHLRRWTKKLSLCFVNHPGICIIMIPHRNRTSRGYHIYMGTVILLRHIFDYQTKFSEFLKKCKRAWGCHIYMKTVITTKPQKADLLIRFVFYEIWLQMKIFVTAAICLII